MRPARKKAKDIRLGLPLPLHPHHPPSTHRPCHLGISRTCKPPRRQSMKELFKQKDANLKVCFVILVGRVLILLVLFVIIISLFFVVLLQIINITVNFKRPKGSHTKKNTANLNKIDPFIFFLAPIAVTSLYLDKDFRDHSHDQGLIHCRNGINPQQGH